MAFVHIAFLAGTLAVAVPIVLHLIMRRQPKHLEFPALRFIKLRETANKRQMRLRHWLLLALRSAVIVLLALALARPSILASGVLGDVEAPVAAALVFDTSPRMQYRQDNKTRLQAAQETATWLLPQLPAESEVAVVDSRTSTAAFSVDVGAARQRIERLDAALASQPLALAIDSACKLVSESDKPRKEIYVFTDLAQAAWSADAMRGIEQTLKQLREVGIYVIDVGAKAPTNFALGEPRLSGEILSKNSMLAIQCDVSQTGSGAERTVELHLVDRETGNATIRGQQLFTIEAGQSQRGLFRLTALEAGTHQGFLKVAGDDALAADNTKWFTVEVLPPWRVLLVAPRDATRKPADYAFFLSQALAPDEFRLKGEAAFDCDVVDLDQLPKSLDGYAAVCLIDPMPVPPAVWQKLHSYVSAGGGLGIFLGRNAAKLDSFNTPAAQGLLPGKLVRQWRSENGVVLAPDNLQHPLVAKFRKLESSVPWEAFPVFRHWQLDPAEGAAVILRYSNNQAAILDRPVGKGRVVALTTPISDPSSRGDAWNLLPTGEEPWPFVMLANEMLYYLVGSGQQRLNYLTGETAVVHLAGERHPIYSLTTPSGDQLRTPADEKQNAVVVTSTEMAGNYRIQAGGSDLESNLGFSANFPADVSRLTRASDDDLKAVFGELPFRLAHNREEIDRSVSAGRVGQELFPYLIVLLAVILGLEQVLANRFYPDYDTAPAKSRAAQLASSSPPPQRETRDSALAR